MNSLNSIFKQLRNIKVLVIGDSIIDEYVFALPKARAVKDPILSTAYQGREFYAGGALAVANHLSGFVDKVNLVTIFGDKQHDFTIDSSSIKKDFLSKGVTLNSFIKKDAYTTLKRRYISPYRYEKLFKMEYVSDEPISLELSRQITTHLEKTIPRFDIVIVCDFGHGFINQAIRETIISKSKWLTLNSQTNSSNNGYNYFTKYINLKSRVLSKPDFLSLTEEELRLPMEMRWEDISTVMHCVAKRMNLKNFIVTLGKRGSLYYNNGEITKAEAPVKNPLDTMGAGDALFAITSLLVYKNMPSTTTLRLGNLAGGFIANSLGNKEKLNPEKIIKFSKEVENAMRN